MFCPVCQAEYRQGFTRCADCDVELVTELPAAAIVRQTSGESGESEEDPFCSFWKGDDPRILAELCELLDKEKIPHRTVRREDHLFHLSNFPAFQIGIPFSMFEKAEAIIKDAYGGGEAIEPASRLLPVDSKHIPGTRFDPGGFGAGGRAGEWNARGSGRMPEAEGSVRAPEGRDSEAHAGSDDAENAVPEDASTEVWSGDEAELAEFIGASLQVNEIAFRRRNKGGKQAVYVQAEDEGRAREIVREVIEGVPPE